MKIHVALNSSLSDEDGRPVFEAPSGMPGGELTSIESFKLVAPREVDHKSLVSLPTRIIVTREFTATESENTLAEELLIGENGLGAPWPMSVNVYWMTPNGARTDVAAELSLEEAYVMSVSTEDGEGASPTQTIEIIGHGLAIKQAEEESKVIRVAGFK